MRIGNNIRFHRAIGIYGQQGSQHKMDQKIYSQANFDLPFPNHHLET